MFKRKQTLSQLIEERKWDGVREKIAAENKPVANNAVSPTTTAAKAEALAGIYLLSNVLASQPPLDVVKALVEPEPDVLSEMDLTGNLPLHVACGNGASMEVVDYLLDEYPDASWTKNEEGKYPMQLAVKHERKIRGRDGKDDDFLKLVSILSLMAPHTCEDDLSRRRSSSEKRKALPTAHAGAGGFKKIRSKLSTIRSPASKAKDLKSQFKSRRSTM